MDEWARHLHRLVHDGIDLELVGEPRAVVAALVQLHNQPMVPRMLYRTAPRASLPANSALSVPLSFAATPATTSSPAIVGHVIRRQTKYP